jgi:hypothetical protein
MRVLVAGRNAKVLAKAAGTFANDLEIHTAATKAACFDLLGRVDFDLIVACETLPDGSGLEVLSHVAVNTPNTLRIFAARPATLILLKGELGLFGLFRTLPYPINFRKLWAAISLAREACAEEVAAAAGSPRRHVVLEETWSGADLGAVTATKPARPPVAASRAVTAAAAPRSSHRQAPTPIGNPQATRPVATKSRAMTAAPRAQPTSGQPSQQRQTAAPPATARPAQRGAATAAGGQRLQQVGGQQAPAPTRVIAVAPRRQPQPAGRQEVTSGMRAAARYAAAHSTPGAAAPVRIPESDAFKRARARRDSGRLEPTVSNESLSQLAKLAITSRPPSAFRGAPAAKNRAAFFVGSGVFAATTAAVLTFFMVSANNSVKHPKLPVIASITQPVPNKVFPWQPETQQPARQAAFMRSEAPASAVADLEAEAEAASESPDGDPDHPGPPPPNAPPPPSEPPSLEAPAQWVDE